MYDEGTWNLIRYTECSLYPGFVIPREFIRSLLGRIQGAKHMVLIPGGSLYPRFIISGVHCIYKPTNLRTFYYQQLSDTASIIYRFNLCMKKF